MTPKEITIRPVEPNDRDEWLRLRSLLWDHTSREDHLNEMHAIISDPETQLVLVAAEVDSLVGFLEVSIRHFVDDCETDHVGYLEGWYVETMYRRSGVGRSLVANAEQWAQSCGCTEMASDAEIGNEESLAAHTQLGYIETSRLIHFRKEIG
jgi:aminoglycoside 6'-N-acetyltransferase I